MAPTKKLILIFGLIATLGIQQATAKQSPQHAGRGSAITFKHSTDGSIIVNGGMKISRSTGIFIDNVTSAVVKKPDGSILKEFTPQELRTITTINVSKDLKGNYQIETDQAAPKKQEYVTVTINNYPDDTEVIVNGMTRILPALTNVTIKGVKNVVIQTTDEAFLTLFTIEDLQDIQSINVSKGPKPGEYLIETDQTAPEQQEHDSITISIIILMTWRLSVIE